MNFVSWQRYQLNNEKHLRSRTKNIVLFLFSFFFVKSYKKTGKSYILNKYIGKKYIIFLKGGETFMKKLVNCFGIFLINVATMSAMTGRSRFIFYEPKMPKMLREKNEKNVVE